MRYYLSAVAIFQNEARFIKDWLEYHLMIGVEHFYLLDNNSTDNVREILKPYIEKDIVSYLDWPYDFMKSQNIARDKGIRAGRSTSQWVAVIDIDEYIVPKHGIDLKTWLKDFEAYPAVAINWQMFGTSGIEMIPSNKTMIETLTRRAEMNHSNNTHIKSIVQPQYTQLMSNPHYGIYAEGMSAVNPSKVNVSGPWSPVCIDDIQINHYCHHDMKFLREQKMARVTKYRPNAMDNINQIDLEYSLIEDTTINQFIPQLRCRLGLD